MLHTVRPDRFVLHLEDVDEDQAPLVGGKGAGLAALLRIEGTDVPPAFCVTTDAFRAALRSSPSVHDQLDRLARLGGTDAGALAELGDSLRRDLEALAVPDPVAVEVTRALARFGEGAAVAVRSSATAEDLPTASFAGQHDSFLGLVGPAAVLRAIARCWASLFSDRALAYRLDHGIDHRAVHMGVVVQQLVDPEAAGTLFTADPLTGNRRLVAIEASPGLGEAVVSGLVDPDRYRVRDGQVVTRAIATKRVAVHRSPAGGTEVRAIEDELQGRPALTDGQVVRLAQLGRHVEAQLGRPQDIEWCLEAGHLRLVQSRPITTLFPVPAVDDDDGEVHVYLSVGHQQMMTDAMKPLGLSLFQMTALRPMHEAGGRLFVDVTLALASRAGRAGLLGLLGRSDPLLGDALVALLERSDPVPLRPDDASAPPLAGEPSAPIDADPALVTALVERTAASVAALERTIEGTSGVELLDVITADVEELRRLLTDPLSQQVVLAGMEAAWWLNERLEAQLGERNPADALSRSVPHNVTSEMGLALLDVADTLRPHPEVVAFLRATDDDGFLDALPALAGGQEARDAIAAYLDRYGMRCVGEIDITRPRWRERPTALLPALLADVERFAPGEHERRVRQGRQAAAAAASDLLARLRALPGGADDAAEAEQMIRRLRTFAGYREHPKYGIVSRYAVYRRALWEEAGRLVQAGVLQAVDDIAYLTFPEVREVLRLHEVDEALLRRRRDDHRWFQALRPPRAMTSDGEVAVGSPRPDGLPAGALVGIPVSAGTVEGRARIVLDPADADLEAGDILVTTHTDPSWSPLFVASSGLVTEVGGLMTHGAVIAREYGLPAVVGVEDATRLLRDGQRIRVDGSLGTVELLSETPPA